MKEIYAVVIHHETQNLKSFNQITQILRKGRIGRVRQLCNTAKGLIFLEPYNQLWCNSSFEKTRALSILTTLTHCVMQLVPSQKS